MIAISVPRRALLPALCWSAGLALVGALTLAIATVAFGFFMSRPARTAIGPPPPDLHAEDVAIFSASGAVLRGWFMEGSPGGGAVVLMHGVHANRLSMVRRARLLNAAGFSILLFDFQAHGESSGTQITFGEREGLDASSAVAFVRQRLPEERIGAIGTSLGGAAALLGPGPLPVDALVLESVYPDIEAAVGDRIRANLGPLALLASPLEVLFERLLPPVLHLDPAKLRPIDHIGEVKAPIFVASGERDQHTTIAEARALFMRAHEPKLFWAVRGAGHVDLEAYAPEEYRHRVLPFLVDNIQQKG